MPVCAFLKPCSISTSSTFPDLKEASPASTTRAASTVTPDTAPGRGTRFISPESAGSNYLGVCRHCGASVESPYNRPRLYCSTRCRRDAQNKRRREERAEARAKRRPCLCPVCGAEFMPSRVQPFFCSPECRREAKRRGIPNEQIFKPDPMEDPWMCGRLPDSVTANACLDPAPILNSQTRERKE